MTQRRDPHFGPGQRPLTPAQRAHSAAPPRAAAPAIIVTPRRSRRRHPLVVTLAVIGCLYFAGTILQALRDPAERAQGAAVMSELQTVARAAVRLRHALRDPGSLETRGERVSLLDPAVVCGQFNARNGFGGYVGYAEFIVDLRRGVTLIQQSFSAPIWQRLHLESCGF